MEPCSNTPGTDLNMARLTDLDFVPTFEALLAAGAQIRGPWLKWLDTVNSRPIEEKDGLAEVLRRYGATE